MPDNRLSPEEKDELADLIDNSNESIDQDTVDEKDFEFDFRQPRHNFEDVVGMDTVKNQLSKKVEQPVQHREKYQSYGLKGVVNGIVLFGPPRVGKSHVAEGFAGHTGFNFLQVNAADIKNKKAGATEGNLRSLVEQARFFQPSIVLLNEVDVLASARDESQQSYKRDMVGTFLDEMESLSGEDVVIIGTTNFVNRIDSAFLQPGRLSTQIWVGMPDQVTRKELLKKGLMEADDHKVEWDDLDLDRVAHLTEGYTCGDIVDEGLLYEAKLKALERDEPVTQKHLLYGVNQSSPGVKDPGKYKRLG